MSILGLSLLEIVIALSAVIAGACLQGSLGFGLGLVAGPVLVLLEPGLVPGPLLCMSVPLALLVAWRERKSLDFGSVRWAVVGRIPGTLLGSMAVLLLSQRGIAGLFAFAVLSAVAVSLLGLSVEPTRRNLLSAGVASGAMGTATSVGGPPIALVYQRSSGPELRASMAAFMIFGASFSLVVLVALGEFDLTDLKLSALLVPGVVVGFVLSRWTNSFLDNGYTRPAVLTFAVISAVSIVIRQVL